MHRTPPRIAPMAPLDLISAPATWNTVDFVSDLHLQQEDATALAFRRYLTESPADAIFLLGDIFEMWVGDDVLGTPDHRFETDMAACLRARTGRSPVYFMPGNRDFLVGTAFCEAAGVQMLTDPCVLDTRSQSPHPATRILLSHGDALCIDDLEYMQFRTQVRSPAWQAGILARPLAERVALGRQLREQSASRKNALGVEGYADVDHPLALEWLAHHDCATLLHGHTHKPGQHQMQEGARQGLRLVLSDWDLTDTARPRGDILRCHLSPPHAPTWDRVAALHA